MSNRNCRTGLYIVRRVPSICPLLNSNLTLTYTPEKFEVSSQLAVFNQLLGRQINRRPQNFQVQAQFRGDNPLDWVGPVQPGLCKISLYAVNRDHYEKINQWIAQKKSAACPNPPRPLPPGLDSAYDQIEGAKITTNKRHSIHGLLFFTNYKDPLGHKYLATI